jgi:hypothetical protein
MPRQHTIPPGQRFGRLVVIGQDLAVPRRKHQRAWALRCDCGAYRSVPTNRLISGKTRSCGCLRREVTTARLTSHGHARKGNQTAEYRAWCGIMDRCLNPTNKGYPYYGGRGITVDPRWLDFSTFLADLGPRPSPAYSVDRVDNALGYAPGNVRWATRGEQAQNRRPRGRPMTAERLRMMHRAATRVRAAIKRGLLTRPLSCEQCGTVRRITAAHADYARPLDVRWLCWPCHCRWDAGEPKTRHR